MRISLTFEERKMIQKLLKLNASCGEIARQLKRAKNTIVVEVRRNGGRESYNAEEAEKLRMFRYLEANRSRAEHNIKMEWNPYKHLQAKIESLEMIVQILTEQIEELNDRINNKL